jgi:anti-sigma regulatory factor (Ser/Thr protein kinase)
MDPAGAGQPIVLVGRVPGNEDAPRAARGILGGLDHAFVISNERLADLHVALSELVTNAVIHGPPGDVAVRVAANDETIRIEVSDDGLQAFEWPEEGREDHWGLDIVKAFTDRCGVERRPWTVAWCEVDLHRGE